jgi:RNA polymerase sigma-70 factor (ECF subfamily)
LSGFRREASFRTWLLSIVWNKSLDHRRSVVRLVRRLVSLDEHPAEAGGEPRGFVAVGASDASPEAGLLHDELRRTLARLVKTLPARLRDPLLLVGTGEYSYDEVAAMLGQPVGTVKWRVSDARRQIRIKLERLGLR